MPPELSIVVPVFNEAESLPVFCAQLAAAAGGMEHERIFVNDGSQDASGVLLDEHAKTDPRVRVLHFTRNFGQTAALAAGFERTRGEFVVTLDAGGQNDPADIPNLIEKLRNGADVVAGWRRDRKDSWIRRLPSHLANGLIRWITGVPLHDHGCTLRAYRRSVLAELRLYGEMHRLIPVWCAWRGARIAEMEVRHRVRTRGASKYGRGRNFKVLLDLVTAKFFYSYLARPSYALGGVGIGLLAAGFCAGVFPVLDKLLFKQWGHLRIPVLIYSGFLVLLGMQFIALGILAEILVRIYYENRNERPFRVERVFPEMRDSSAGRPG